MRSDNIGKVIRVDNINTAINSILAILVNNITIISVISKIKDIVNSVVKPRLADSSDALRYIRSTSSYCLKERRDKSTINKYSRASYRQRRRD